jgi:hypothetical protein
MFQLYEDPRAGTYRPEKGKTQIVSILGVYLVESGARVQYLIVDDPKGDYPRLVPGILVDIYVGQKG